MEPPEGPQNATGSPVMRSAAEDVPHYRAEMRWYLDDPSGQRTRELVEDRERKALLKHVAPGSVLIGAMGNYWQPGCFEAVEAMAQYHADHGFLVGLYFQPDLCFEPYDSLGTMRNTIYRKALMEGWEWLCYVDNDVQPPPDALGRLMNHHLPVVGPRVEYPGGAELQTVGASRLTPNQGLAMVGSIILSFVLFKTNVFAPFLVTDFWSDAIGAAERYHFDRLAAMGIPIMVDTNVTVKVTKQPTFPLDRRPEWNRRSLLERPV